MTERSRSDLDAARSGWLPGPLDAATAPPRRQPARGRRRSADVVVIGAGLSGLLAAHRLASDGASVVVLEARPDRVGGRLETVELAGTRVDLGGCWVGAAHTRTRALLDELGLATSPAYDRGERVTLRAGRGSGRLARHLTVSAVERATARFERLAPPADDPPSWAGAADLDATTLADWIATYSTRVPRGRTAFGDTLANVLAADPADVSLLHALWYVRSGGGLASLVAVAGGAQQDQVAGGAQALADGLATQLGDAVELDTPVRAIGRTATGVRVLSDRLEVDAERAIVALSPALRSRISIDPAPPRTAAPAFRPGDAIKLVAVYDEPFWRRDGLSGMAWGDALPFSFTRDAAHGEPGVLAIFAVGARARRLRALAAPERDRQVTRALVRCFGARAARPIALAARDWTAEAWSLGGYGSTAAPGDWTATANARPRSTDDRIVLAGTESSAEHHGYMEGAVRAAERAAATVLAAA